LPSSTKIPRSATGLEKGCALYCDLSYLFLTNAEN
jgi:hypothetical protein